jgi:ABC-type sugar transport system ATPase subunit
VAGFIGAPPMNLVPGRIVRAHDGPAVELPAGVILPLAQTLAVAADATIAGIRPEHFEWAPTGQAAAIEVAAAIVEPLGSDTLVGIGLGEHNLQVRLPPRQVRRAGELVRLNVAPEHVHLFDGDGRRIAG